MQIVLSYKQWKHAAVGCMTGLSMPLNLCVKGVTDRLVREEANEEDGASKKTSQPTCGVVRWLGTVNTVMVC